MGMVSPLLPPGFAFSQSSLQDYCDCPRRFQLRYIEQLQWPAVETEPILENERRLQEGQLFHRLVQQHLIGLPTDKLARLANTPDLSCWWENYLNYKFDISGNALYTELTLAAPVRTYRLLAKYDLVVYKPQEQVLVYDWKTYRKRPRDEWMAARMQTRVYRALLIQAGATLNGGTPFLPEQIEMIYWYANYPSESAHLAYNAAQYKRDWDALTGLINEISNHRYFPLSEDENKCAYCYYRSFCNRGGKAGTLDELADGRVPDPAQETELNETGINFEQIAEIEF
jgi:hypothetical protein